MRKSRKIKVRGKQRVKIDPAQLVQVLVAIAMDWASDSEPANSPDVFEAAIEDSQGSS